MESSKEIELSAFRNKLEEHFKESDMIDLIEPLFKKVMSGRIQVFTETEKDG